MSTALLACSFVAGQCPQSMFRFERSYETWVQPWDLTRIEEIAESSNLTSNRVQCWSQNDTNIDPQTKQFGSVFKPIFGHILKHFGGHFGCQLKHKIGPRGDKRSSRGQGKHGLQDAKKLIFKKVVGLSASKEALKPQRNRTYTWTKHVSNVGLILERAPYSPKNISKNISKRYQKQWFGRVPPAPQIIPSVAA